MKIRTLAVVFAVVLPALAACGGSPGPAEYLRASRGSGGRL